MTLRFLTAAVVATVCAPHALAQNIALHKTVTIVSGAGSLLDPTPPPGVVTDGVFLNEVTDYSHQSAVSGSLRWNTGLAGSTTIEIDLGGPHTIDGIIVQADDNDALEVTYRTAEGEFLPLYTVQYVSVGWGFRTRPDANQTTYAPLAPVTTSAVRVINSGGDGYYGISELQLRGVAVSGCDPDVNCDGSPDQGDVACMILAVAGDVACICQDPDFNLDGSADQGDVASLIGVVAGQACP